MVFAAGAAAGLLAFLVFGPLVAQTAPPPDGPPGGGPPPHGGDRFGPAGGMSPELQETMHIYMLFRLTEELELSDEQALKLMPLIKERENAGWEFFGLQAEKHRELSAMVEDDEVSDAEIENLLNELRQAQRTYHEQEEQLELEIAALLSPRQFAKFLVFKQQFHRDMQQRVRRLRGMDHKGRRGDRAE
jgi:Spy/CpxP family protein refolding chaperone